MPIDKLAQAIEAYKRGHVSFGYVQQMLDAQRAAMRAGLAALEAIHANDAFIEQPQMDEAIATLRKALEN